MKTLLSLLAIATVFVTSSAFAGDCSSCSGGDKGDSGKKDAKKDSAMVTFAL